MDKNPMQDHYSTSGAKIAKYTAGNGTSMNIGLTPYPVQS